MYSVPAPAPRYDINFGDFVHPNYADQFNGFNTGSVEPPYSQYMPNGVFPPTFQDANSAFYHQAPGGRLPNPSFQPNGYTFDGGPTFQQMSPLSGNTPSSSSQLSYETTWTPPPGPSFGNIPQLYPEVLEDNAPPPSPAPRARRRRTRGPNRRPPGTGFSDLLDELSNDVRAAVEAYNPACCGNKRPPEEGKGKEDSSRLKHIFSNRHCAGLPKYIQDEVLYYICPAFVAHHKECPRAKAGRYDSAVRHCENCRGFLEMKEEGPVRITKGQYLAIVECRATETPSAKTEGQAAIALTRLLEPIFKNKD